MQLGVVRLLCVCVSGHCDSVLLVYLDSRLQDRISMLIELTILIPIRHDTGSGFVIQARTIEPTKKATELAELECQLLTVFRTGRKTAIRHRDSPVPLSV